MSIITRFHIWIKSINIIIIVSMFIMIEFYLIKKPLISFLKRLISFSFVWATKFDRARTSTRAFDRWDYNDLKFCRRNFYYAAGKSGLCMNFLLVEWKKWWWNFLLVERKKNKFFNVIISVSPHWYKNEKIFLEN